MSATFDLQNIVAANEALTKRVAELEAYNQRLLSGENVTLQLVQPAIPESELLRHWVEQANQQLQRVHERERQLVPMEHELSEARRHIHDLQSQLAWTPVAQGLPTEPGVYEFVKCSNECLHSCDLFEFCPDRENEGEEWGDMLTCEHFCTDELQELEHTHFRRITLPEAT